MDNALSEPLARRSFLFSSANALGGIALASLLQRDGLLASESGDSAGQSQSRHDRLGARADETDLLGTAEGGEDQLGELDLLEPIIPNTIMVNEIDPNTMTKIIILPRVLFFICFIFFQILCINNNFITPDTDNITQLQMGYVICVMGNV